MVERNLAKVEVASSNLVSRSKYEKGPLFEGPFFVFETDQVNACPQLCSMVVVHRVTGRFPSIYQRLTRWVSRSKYEKGPLFEGPFFVFETDQVNACPQLCSMVVVHRVTGRFPSIYQRLTRWVSRSKYEKGPLFEGPFFVFETDQVNACPQLCSMVVVHRVTGRFPSIYQRLTRWVSRSKYEKGPSSKGPFSYSKQTRLTHGLTVARW